MLRQPLSDTLTSIVTYVMKIKMSGTAEQRTQKQQDCPGAGWALVSASTIRLGQDRRSEGHTTLHVI